MGFIGVACTLVMLLWPPCMLHCTVPCWGGICHLNVWSLTTYIWLPVRITSLLLGQLPNLDGRDIPITTVPSVTTGILMFVRWHHCFSCFCVGVVGNGHLCSTGFWICSFSCNTRLRFVSSLLHSDRLTVGLNAVHPWFMSVGISLWVVLGSRDSIEPFPERFRNLMEVPTKWTS